ncbi:MAG: WbqC family protein [Candidatus Tantalella remota]|nr:WbqC family protein [Candidatus Tantalella remota]
MKIAIHQPQYLPWVGYFDKMDRADVFVILDDVQYKKNEWQNRNKIRNADGWQWITVPVVFEFGQKITEVGIDNKQPWKEKHLRSLEMNYSRADGFKEHFSFFKDAYEKEWKTLVDINGHFINYLKDVLGIQTEIVISSSLGIKTEKTRRLIDICEALNADTYISGAGGADYLEESEFPAHGITLEFQDYKHPEYRQMYEGFESYMSIVDLLFCQGGKSLEIIRSGRN